MKFAYLLIMLFTLSYPLYKSFENNIHFVNQWKYVFKATLPVAFFFILWDNWFTKLNIWSFNDSFVLGWFIGYLPLEEYLFFFFVPFSCLFIYEVVNYYVKKDILKKYVPAISWSLILLLSVFLYFCPHKLYPLILFPLLILVLLLHLYIFKSSFLGKFYLSFAVCIAPFLLVNGLLTGLPIIRYNPTEIMGLYILTIPLEDLFYGLLMLLLITSFYEYFRSAKKS
ncbi:MAG TPA: lycopene cyclase domain-containing protein [Cytophagaceae bacterium]|nr:lycopene cyclase domain-containing protein [Cytophagaceae bacterium]